MQEHHRRCQPNYRCGDDNGAALIHLLVPSAAGVWPAGHILPIMTRDRKRQKWFGQLGLDPGVLAKAAYALGGLQQ
jgi:hypothetical protein